MIFDRGYITNGLGAPRSRCTEGLRNSHLSSYNSTYRTTLYFFCCPHHLSIALIIFDRGYITNGRPRRLHHLAHHWHNYYPSTPWAFSVGAARAHAWSRRHGGDKMNFLHLSVPLRPWLSPIPLSARLYKRSTSGDFLNSMSPCHEPSTQTS
jgi:hypothetical protein